jgi:hypothetical protein
VVNNLRSAATVFMACDDVTSTPGAPLYGHVWPNGHISSRVTQRSKKEEAYIFAPFLAPISPLISFYYHFGFCFLISYL